MRHTGIDMIGDVGWGTHFCQFYQDKQDLIDILIPYFKAGLENNELCMWITSEPLRAEEAKSALSKEIEGLDDYVRKGQIEILDYRQWYTPGGKFDADRVLQGWVDKHDAARRRAFDGLRLSGNTFWLERSDWRDFTDYEATIDGIIGRYRMLAICTYSLERCGAVEIMDVVANHAFALVKRAGKWQVIEQLERKRLEASLRESEAHGRLLFETMLQGSVFQDADGKITSMNPAAERILGKAPEEFLGETSASVERETIRADGSPFPGAEHPAMEALATGHEVRNVVMGVRNPREGQTRWIKIDAVPLFRACEPKPSQVYTIFEDITDRKKAEEALRRQSEWLRVTLTSIGDAVMATDGDGRIVFLNPVAVKLTGWAVEEALGRPVQEVFRVINERTRAEAEDIVARVLRERRAVSLANETALATRDGREIPIEDSAAPIRDGAGGVAGVVLVFHDVTEKRRAQEALRRSEQRVRQKLESILSPEGDIGDLELEDVIDTPAIQSLMDDFYALARIPMSIVDLKGKVLVGVGWQEVCTRFHRVHPETRRNCLESDTQLTTGIAPGEFKLYKCKNQMWDIAMPLTIGGKHVGHLFSGQFFFEDEPADGDLFRSQAAKYGFDEREYLAAVDAAPRLSKQAVETGMAYLRKLGHMFSALSHSNLKLARSLSERDRLMAELQREEEKLRKLNRTLRAVSRTDQALVLAADEAAYLKEVCKIIVEDCGHAMVWVGYAENDAVKTVRPVASAGFEEGYLETLKVTWDDTGRGRGPTGTAIRTGKVCACRNMQTDPLFEPWREEALRRGYASSIVLPLLDGERAFGAINIYSKEPDPFSEDEEKLLTELANDFAHAINVLRLRAAHAQSAQVLRASEERFRVLAEAMPHLVWSTDQEGNAIYLNRRWIEYTGREAATAEEREELIHPEDRPRVRERWQEACRSGSDFECEYRLRRQDGDYRWVLARSAVKRAATGEVLGWIGTATDVHNLKVTEEALRKSEARASFLADIIEKAGQPVAVGYFDGRLGICNPAFSELTGYSAEELRSIDWAKVLTPPEFIESEMAALREANRTGRPARYQKEYIRKNGTRVPIEVFAHPVQDEAGRTLCYYGFVTDITERKQAEEALQRSEALYREIARNLPDGAVYVVDRDLRYLVADGGLSARIGLDREKLEGHTLRESLDAETLAIVEPRWRRTLAGEQTSGETEYRGRTLWHQFVPLCDESGNVIAAMALALDITERKRAEERLRQTQKLEGIGLLAGGIAHDFNNLLVGVIGNASLAEDMLPYGSPAAELVKRIIRAGEQAANLTRQMLAYAGKGRFVLEPVNLSSIVAEASGLIQGSVSKKITLSLQLDPNIPAVESDPSQMQQVFMNLAINAGEAIGSAPGVITVRTGEARVDAAYIRQELAEWPIAPGRCVFLEVRDTGCGMDEADKSRIFDPFFTTKFQGRGLGLAAVAGIVRSHKGAIQLTTARGAGSTFRVLLPAIESGAAARAPAADSLRDLRGKGTILVVDDEPEVRHLARQALGRQGYEVLPAESGAAALEIVRAHGDRIGLVVLDLSMPGMGGEEALLQLRKLKPELNVIVSSGFSEAEALRAFEGARISGFIQKPYTVRELAAAVQAALA